MAVFVAKIGENNLDFYSDEIWHKVKEIAEKYLFFHWDLEFLDIFYGDDGKRKKNPGFDCVVGNPPYFNLTSDDVLKNCPDYPLLVEGVLNASSLFVKKNIDLLHNNGGLGCIIPKSFLVVNSWKPIRDLVLEYSLQIVNDVGKQWEDVGLEQTIIIIKKNKSQIETHILNKFNSINHIKQSVFKKRGVILTCVNNDKLSIIEIMERGATLLGSIADMPRGINVKSSEYSSIPQTDFIQVLGGTNIERFFIKSGNKRKPDKYLKNTDSRIKSKKIFEQTRIIYQNIASSVPKIVATLENNNLPTDDTINNLIIKDKNFSYECILQILNSNLITFYLRYALINNSILTVHLDKSLLQRLPIKKNKVRSEHTIDSITRNKSKIENIYKKLMNRIRKNFPQTEISYNLEKYYAFVVSGFIQELEKYDKIKLSDKNKLEDYFNEFKKEITSPYVENKKILKNINNYVYKLYDITDEQIKIIEESIK